MQAGDYTAGAVARRCAWLRTGQGLFRAFQRIAAEPRPYQPVPLLMALRQEPRATADRRRRGRRKDSVEAV
jgi:hypothetical protein